MSTAVANTEPRTAEPDDLSVDTNRRVLFIAGWGRSGSTLLANLLGDTSDAVNLGELRYLWTRGLDGTQCGCGVPVIDCRYWTQVLDRSGWSLTDHEEIRQFDSRVGATAIFRQLAAILTGRTDEYRERYAADVDEVRKIISSTAHRPETLIIDSSKSIPFLINILGDDSFDVEVLHLTRDPRAVAYSWSRLTDTLDADGVMFPRFGPLRSSLYWTIFNLVPLFLRSVPYDRLAYEDFVEDPKATVESLCERYQIRFPEAQWLDERTAQVSVQHTISGNPSRFKTGPTVVKPDKRWTTKMAGRNRFLVALCTAPARFVLTRTSDRRKALSQ